MLRLLMKNFLLLSVLSLCLPLAAARGEGGGRLSGEVLYGLSDYRSKVSRRDAEKMAVQYEQLSVSYEKKGLLRDARLGRYTLLLGYEFTAIDPDRHAFGVHDDRFTSVTAQKLYYNGALLLAPGGLPFRLTLFAKDLHRTEFVDVPLSDLPVGNQGRADGSAGRLLDVDMPGDIKDGTHRSIGGSLLIGIRNGSYLGSYRDVLSQLPRFLIDYKQEDVEDKHSLLQPQHNRTRDLAFVSLNKKDNWLHYRMSDHTDYRDPENNTVRKQVLLGTIDHLLSRNWINLTNWIKISGDLSYSTTEQVRREYPEKTYLLNLFALTRRNDVSSSIFSTFSRETDGRYIATESNIPVTVQMELNRETQLRTRFIFEEKEKSTFLGGVRNLEGDVSQIEGYNYRDLYLDAQLELQRRQRIIIKPRLEIESRSEGQGNQEGLAMRLGAEVLNNYALDRNLDWTAGYSLTAINAQDTLTQEDGTYLQSDLYGRVDKDLGRTLRLGARGTLATGSGGGREVLAFRIPVISGALSEGGGSSENIVDSSYAGRLSRGNVNLYVEHLYQKMKNIVELGYEFTEGGGSMASQRSLRHYLSYNDGSHSFECDSEITSGDNTGSSRSVSFDYLSKDSSGRSDRQSSWHNQSRYHYNPDRRFGLELLGEVSGQNFALNNVNYKVSEKIDYRIFTTNGIVRRLVEFSEEAGLEKVSQSLDGREGSLYGRLSAAYFPVKFFYVKLRSEVTQFLGESALQQTYTSEGGFDFEKVKIIASYSQGMKDRESENLPEVEEKRWDLKVKKIF